ncbi:unnamed protein product [Thlaspi arvense]|uniref:EF-hand domain-containing protein n=1 Tax=Thlaspi arvense TaxID=13288 RepID=A0AAU9RIT5_THLAR|nr:unnamed protein product [Thlaspi arvense]
MRSNGLDCGPCFSLDKVNLTGIPHGLSFQETKELWVRADLDGNGVFDYEEELKKIWNMTMMNQSGNCKESVVESRKEEGEDKEEEEEAVWIETEESGSVSGRSRERIVARELQPLGSCLSHPTLLSCQNAL